jgi:hypothetical protein
MQVVSDTPLVFEIDSCGMLGCLSVWLSRAVRMTFVTFVLARCHQLSGVMARWSYDENILLLQVAAARMPQQGFGTNMFRACC